MKVESWEVKDNYFIGNRGGGMIFGGAHSSFTGNHFNTNGGAASPKVGLRLNPGTVNNFVDGNFFLGHDIGVQDQGTSNDIRNNHGDGTQ